MTVLETFSKYIEQQQENEEVQELIEVLRSKQTSFSDLEVPLEQLEENVRIQHKIKDLQRKLWEGKTREETHSSSLIEMLKEQLKRGQFVVLENEGEKYRLQLEGNRLYNEFKLKVASVPAHA